MPSVAITTILVSMFVIHLSPSPSFSTANVSGWQPGILQKTKNGTKKLSQNSRRHLKRHSRESGNPEDQPMQPPSLRSYLCFEIFSRRLFSWMLYGGAVGKATAGLETVTRIGLSNSRSELPEITGNYRKLPGLEKIPRLSLRNPLKSPSPLIESAKAMIKKLSQNLPWHINRHSLESGNPEDQRIRPPSSWLHLCFEIFSKWDDWAPDIEISALSAARLIGNARKNRQKWEGMGKYGNPREIFRPILPTSTWSRSPDRPPRLYSSDSLGNSSAICASLGLHHAGC